jgi:hypothetical protein
MNRTKKEIEERMLEVFHHMLIGGKVIVKDSYDNTVKESSITAVYSDRMVTLCDTISSDYGIFDITLKPKKIDIFKQ